MSKIKVELLDHMGDDLRIANVARVSFGKWKEELDDKDVRLINYLAAHEHNSPFRHVQVSIRCKAPVFLARQLVKHCVGLSWNEISRRYVDSDIEFYEPKEWRSRPDGSIKQGSGTGKMPEPNFTVGYCAYCGNKVEAVGRAQGGGRQRKFCGDKCKYTYSNLNRNPYKAVFDNAKSRAKREGKEWTLEFDTFEFPEYCPYLGIKIDYNRGKEFIQPNSPSFDKIDPALGYAEGNVELVSNRANSMKNDASVEEQVKMAEAVLLRHKGYIPNYEMSYEGVCQKALDLYNKMVVAGYAPEMARMILPQSMMVDWVWTGSLEAFYHMYRLRSGEGAQEEAKEFAQKVKEVVQPIFPNAWKALTGE